MNKPIITAVVTGMAIATLAASGATAQRYDDYEYENAENSLTLICWGEGRKPGTSVSTGYSWDHRRNKFVPETYIQNTTKEFDSEVQIELHDDWGRIHLTGKLIPTIHSGGLPRPVQVWPVAGSRYLGATLVPATALRPRAGGNTSCGVNSNSATSA